MGITRKGIPVIVNPQTNELKPWLMEKLIRNNVPCFFADDIFAKEFPDQQLPIGIYPKPWIECFQTSLSAMQILFNAKTKQKQIWFNAAQRVNLTGRLDIRHNVFWSKYKKNFKTLLTDGGHNQDALLALSEFVSDNNLSPCTLIMAIASDKLNENLEYPLKQLCKNAETIILTSIHSPRSANPEFLKSFLNNSCAVEHSPLIKISDSAEDALEMSLITPKTPVVVAGSFYLVGMVMRLLGINTE